MKLRLDIPNNIAKDFVEFHAGVDEDRTPEESKTILSNIIKDHIKATLVRKKKREFDHGVDVSGITEE